MGPAGLTFDVSMTCASYLRFKHQDLDSFLACPPFRPESCCTPFSCTTQVIDGLATSSAKSNAQHREKKDHATLTTPELIYLDLVAPSSRIEGGEGTNRPGTNNNSLLPGHALLHWSTNSTTWRKTGHIKGGVQACFIEANRFLDTRLGRPCDHDAIPRMHFREDAKWSRRSSKRATRFFRHVSDSRCSGVAR